MGRVQRGYVGIYVSKATRDALKHLKRLVDGGIESYDDVILRLIALAEEAK